MHISTLTVTVTTHLSLWIWPLSWPSHSPARPSVDGVPQCLAYASGGGCKQCCCSASVVHSGRERGCPLLEPRARSYGPSCCFLSGTQSRHAHTALLSHSHRTEKQTLPLSKCLLFTHFHSVNVCPIPKRCFFFLSFLIITTSILTMPNLLHIFFWFAPHCPLEKNNNSIFFQAFLTFSNLLLTSLISCKKKKRKQSWSYS